MGIQNHEISIAKIIAYGLYNFTSCLGVKRQQSLSDLFLRYDCDPFFGISNVKWFLKSMEKNGQDFCLQGLNLRNINRLSLYRDIQALIKPYALEFNQGAEQVEEKMRTLEDRLLEN